MTAPLFLTLFLTFHIRIKKEQNGTIYRIKFQYKTEKIKICKRFPFWVEFFRKIVQHS